MYLLFILVFLHIGNEPVSCFLLTGPKTILSQVSLSVALFQKIKESTAANGCYDFPLVYQTKTEKKELLGIGHAHMLFMYKNEPE